MSVYADVTEDILGEHGLNDALIEEDLPSEAEEAEEGDEEKKVDVKIEPKKRSVRNPKPRLTIDILRGPRGIHTLEDYFKDVKFKGKGHEKQDLDEIMRRMQHWAHRMYPNYKFDDILSNVERLGKKKQLQQYMSKYRQDLLEPQKVGEVLETHDQDAVQDEPFDEFDALLGEQIAISKLASRTPSHYGNTSVASSVVNTPRFTEELGVASTPTSSMLERDLEPASQMPPKLTSEQLARIAENRRLAQERLKAKREAANKSD